MIISTPTHQHARTLTLTHTFVCAEHVQYSIARVINALYQFIKQH